MEPLYYGTSKIKSLTAKLDFMRRECDVLSSKSEQSVSEGQCVPRLVDESKKYEELATELENVTCENVLA